MRFLRVLMMVLVGLSLTACGSSKFRTYNGPEVTSIQVHKAERKMYLLHDGKVLKTYDIGLGFAPKATSNSRAMARRPKAPITSAIAIRNRAITCRWASAIRTRPTWPLLPKQISLRAVIS